MFFCGFGATRDVFFEELYMKNGLIKPTEIRNVCVYCGSGSGRNPKFAEAARELGRALAENSIRLIYGGGALGLMGEVARATIDHGGQVTGIIPDFLIQREQMLRDVHEVVVTDTMHERKQLMFERSDGFVALPGGAGTLDELIEQITWSQLGQHKKPVVIDLVDIAQHLFALNEKIRNLPRPPASLAARSPKTVSGLSMVAAHSA